MKAPQFSLRRLLVSITLIAVAIAMYKLAGVMFDRRDGETIGNILVLSCPAVFGAGVGMIFGRPILGAFVFLVLALIGFTVVMRLFGGPHGVEYR